MDRTIKHYYTKEMKLDDWSEARANFGHGTEYCEECNEERKVGDLTINGGNDGIYICWGCFNKQYKVGLPVYDYD